MVSHYVDAPVYIIQMFGIPYIDSITMINPVIKIEYLPETIVETVEGYGKYNF